MADDQQANFVLASVNPAFGNQPCNGIAYTWSKVLANTGIANADGPGLSGNNAFTYST